jgi:hypothetical protein
MSEASNSATGGKNLQPPDCNNSEETSESGEPVKFAAESERFGGYGVSVNRTPAP